MHLAVDLELHRAGADGDLVGSRVEVRRGARHLEGAVVGPDVVEEVPVVGVVPVVQAEERLWRIPQQLDAGDLAVAAAEGEALLDCALARLQCLLWPHEGAAVRARDSGSEAVSFGQRVADPEGWGPGEHKVIYLVKRSQVQSLPFPPLFFPALFLPAIFLLFPFCLFLSVSHTLSWLCRLNSASTGSSLIGPPRLRFRVLYWC